MAAMNQLVLVAGDSRLRGFDYHIRSALDDMRAFTIDVECLSVPGGGVREVVRTVHTGSASDHYDQIYILAGVCDLMHKRSGRNLVPRFDALGDMISHMDGLYTAAQIDLLKMTEKPVLCELIGLDVATDNVNGRPHPYYQDIINAAVPIINRRVNGLNVNIEAIPRGPFLATYVHKTRRGHMTHRYDLVLNDGVHFTDYFKVRVAQAMARVIVQN